MSGTDYDGSPTTSPAAVATPPPFHRSDHHSIARRIDLVRTRARRHATASAPRPAEDSALFIAVEATRFARDHRGIGRYVRALVPRLCAARADLRLTLFVRDAESAVDAQAEFASAHGESAAAVSFAPVAQMTSARPALWWFPWNFVSPVPRGGPIVVTIHDVAPLAVPDPRFRALYRNWLWRRRYAHAAQHATLIIADSAFTATEVTTRLGVARDRIRVVHLAADDAPAPPAGDDAAVLERLGVTRPFVLTVGAADHRKNIGLAEAAVGRAVAGGTNIALVQAGPRKRSARTAEAPWNRSLGFVAAQDLAALYRTATALVVTSTYEGFGLPLLEAMRFGTPVVASRVASLPEVGGDAVAWFAPHDVDGLAAHIARLAVDDTERARMAAAGRARAAQFSWDATARETLAAFDEAVRRGR
jgi:glycosyltransferase involved in cell wall biosynthesis